MAKVLVGVSGGVAAYKAVEFVRLAVLAGHSVRVIQTPASLRFVGRATFSAITGAPVLVSEFESDPSRGCWPGEELPEHAPISHLALVENADVFVVAPATANLISRVAAGSSDELVSAAVLAANCRVLVAPAMNHRMWENPATVANVATLRERGITVLEPGEGQLASHGEAGKGRLIEPRELLAALDSAGGRSDFRGVRVLVTAGGTREAIDPVRFIGNRSSGRMGAALANAAASRGAEVTIICANSSIPTSSDVKVINVVSAAELGDACDQQFPNCDLLLMAAAVADFIPTAAADQKIKKSEGVPTIGLTASPDILAGLAGERRADQTVIGFAAEHGGDPLANARTKLKGKQLDALVLNDVSVAGIGFESEENLVTFVSADQELELPRGPKLDVAHSILDQIKNLGTNPQKG